MNKLKILFAIIIVAVVSLVIYKINNKTDIKLDTNLFTTAKTRDINRKIFVPGEIQPQEEVQVKSNMSGILAELYVKLGDEVKKGDKLAKISMITDPITMERLERQLRIVTIEYNDSKLNFERQKTLYEKKVIAKSDFEAAQSQLQMQEIKVSSINNEIELQSEKNSSQNAFNIVKATRGGTIMELPLKVGGSIVARNSYNDGTTIASIADLNALVFKGKVLESDISYLKIDMDMKIKIGALQKQAFTGVLNQISPKGVQFDGSNKFDILAKIVPLKEHDYSEIRAGYSATAEIILENKENILAIKERYIDIRNDSALVEVYDENLNNFFEKNILLGISDGINIEILEGLSLTDKIKIK